MAKSIGEKVYNDFMSGYSIRGLMRKYKRPLWDIENFIREWGKGGKYERTTIA